MPPSKFMLTSQRESMCIHKCTNTYFLLSPFGFTCMTMCPGLTTWDRKIPPSSLSTHWSPVDLLGAGLCGIFLSRVGISAAAILLVLLRKSYCWDSWVHFHVVSRVPSHSGHPALFWFPLRLGCAGCAARTLSTWEWAVLHDQVYLFLTVCTASTWFSCLFVTCFVLCWLQHKISGFPLRSVLLSGC